MADQICFGNRRRLWYEGHSWPFDKKYYNSSGAHTRRRSSVLVEFVVFCVHMYRFAGFDKADATADIQ